MASTSEPSPVEEDRSAAASRAALSLEAFLESQADLRKLASVQFPLPRAEFQVQVELLAKVVEAKLRFPEEVRWPNGSHDDYQVRQLFWLVHRWQHQAFIEPLLGLLRGNPQYRYYAAEALLRYGDAELRQVVEEFRGFEHKEWGSADTFSTLTIDELLEKVPPGPPPPANFREYPTLLPPLNRRSTWGNFAEPAQPEEMRVPLALLALASESRSIRLQAWIWLADRGIVGPELIVQEAWEALSKPQREYLMLHDRETPYLGEDRAQRLWEWFLNRPRGEYSLEVEGSILVKLSSLESRAGFPRMKEIIVERLPLIRSGADAPPLYEQDPLLFHALLAMTQSGLSSDLPCWLRLTESSHPEVREYAWAGVARTEQPEAVRELERALLEEDPFVLMSAVAKLNWAGRRLTPLRWEYLDLLAKALRRRTPDWFLYPDLIDAFAELSHKQFGHNGRYFPSGLDEEAARATAARCLEWYRENRPREGS
jgi:hypothetical protein